MAYAQIKQAYADPPTENASYHDLTLGRTPSPYLGHVPPSRLSLSFEDITGDVAVEDPNARPEHAVTKLLTSLTSSSHQSYDLVEDDDYEVTDQITPTLERQRRHHDMATEMETFAAPPALSDTPVRTASISRHLPLNHPKPDLQSLQGAYVKNVERLEESAAQLSTTSSLDEELQRMREVQKQVEETDSMASRAVSAQSSVNRPTSARSASNSMDHANVAVPLPLFSSVNQQTKSLENTQSTSIPRPSSPGFSQVLQEPGSEGGLLHDGFSFSEPQPLPGFGPELPRLDSASNASHVERPNSSGSGDTYQQAKTLFTDFDGVHYAPDRHLRASRRISLTRPPRARDSRAFKEPQPGEEMIYYPAPVPVMLNLPMRLSQLNWSDREKKRLHALSGIPDDMRKSAAWLATEEGIPPAHNRNTVVLPPQLRASAFFDHRGTTQDVQLKNGSAVATLDSILDAAAHAPVSAFTDHPIAGHLGDDFYGAERPARKSMQKTSMEKTKRKSSANKLLRKRTSSANLSEVMARESRVPSMNRPRSRANDDGDEALDDEAERSIAPDEDELPDGESDSQSEGEESDRVSESHESQHLPGYSAAPTTLLAELQMRKAQQRMRNRTAADAFPNGMHSTLLELDTVTQLQQKARKQKHVQLAWEDKDLVDKENFEDDDIPLGMLFPEKERQSNVNFNRPLGLMEKKEIEENEPLSHRRARLRGEPIQSFAPALSPGLSPGDVSDKPTLDLPSVNEPQDEETEGETLAQRRQRIKERKEKGTSAAFAREVSSELGLAVPAASGDTPQSPALSKTPDVEETLGQRRKRLQAEALNGGVRNVSGESNGIRPSLRTKNSLGDLLRANPVGYNDSNESKTAHLAAQTRQKAMQREANFRAELSRNQQPQNVYGNGHQGGMMHTPVDTSHRYQQPYEYVIGNTPVAGNQFNPLQQNYGLQNGFHYPAQTTPMDMGANMNMNMGMNMGMANMQANYPYQYPALQGYGQPSALDLSGMGPPLDSKQRARIEGWRQGVM